MFSKPNPNPNLPLWCFVVMPNTKSLKNCIKQDIEQIEKVQRQFTKRLHRLRSYT